MPIRLHSCHETRLNGLSKQCIGSFKRRWSGIGWGFLISRISENTKEITLLRIRATTKKITSKLQLQLGSLPVTSLCIVSVTYTVKRLNKMPNYKIHAQLKHLIHIESNRFEAIVWCTSLKCLHISSINVLENVLTLHFTPECSLLLTEWCFQSSFWPIVVQDDSVSSSLPTSSWF